MESDSSTSTLYATLSNSNDKDKIKEQLRHQISRFSIPRCFPEHNNHNSEPDTSYLQVQHRPEHSVSTTSLNHHSSSSNHELAKKPPIHDEALLNLSSHGSSSCTFRTIRSITPKPNTDVNMETKELSSTNLLSQHEFEDNCRNSFHITTPESTHCLCQESDSFIDYNTITIPHSIPESQEATIFELRFEDRQRIAKLITELANAQQQIQLLESQIEYEHEGYRQTKEEQLKTIQLLSDKCKTLVAQNASRMDMARKGNLKEYDEYKHQMEKRLQEEVEQQRHLKDQISLLEQTNTSLQTRLTTVEKKYSRCLEDNQRLKWILRTIQQREEILLTHNKCFNLVDKSVSVNETEQREHEYSHTPNKEVIRDFKLRTKSPYHALSKANNTESEPFLHVPPKPYISETTQTEKISSSSTRSHLGSPSVPSSSFLEPNNDLNMRALQHQSGGDFHEFHFYEPHIVIPSMNSPVIMKIPKSPLTGLSSQQLNFGSNNLAMTTGLEQNTVSSTKALLFEHNMSNTDTNKSNVHIESHQENKEEDILRELFYKF